MCNVEKKTPNTANDCESTIGTHFDSVRLEDSTRKRLHRKYDEVLSHKLTLVAAPSGYGKTVLLESWVNEFRTNPKVCVDLLNADRLVYSGNQFWEHFSAALHLPIKKTVFKKNTSKQNEKNELIGTVADALTSNLPASTVRVIMIDNFDFIRDEETKKSFFSLIHFIKTPVHFVISTESSSLVDFLGLRTRSDLFELTSADLAFTLGETIEYLKEDGFAVPQCEDIHNTTEGWPLGVVFASRMAVAGLPAGAKMQFDGSNRDVDDFFTAYLRDRMPKGVIKILITISIVDEFCAQLCEAITDISDGQSLLFELENKMIYVVPLDYERKWYRFNNLFLSWLRLKLPQRFSEDQIRDAAHRTSDWYQAVEKPDESAKYVVVATDIKTITKIIDSVMDSSGIDSKTFMLDLLNKSIDDAFMSSPQYCLFVAWAYVHQGRPEDSLYWIDRFQKLLGREIACDNDAKPYWLTVEVVRAICCTMQNNFDEGISKLQFLYDEYEPELSPTLKALLTHGLAEALERVGDFTGAKESHTDSIVFGECSDSAYVRLYGLYELGLIETLQGSLDEALELFERGFAESERDQTVRGAFLSAMARVQMERMDIEMAQKNLEESVVFFSSERNVDLLLESFATRAELLLLQGKVLEASTLIFEAIRIADKKAVPRHIPLAVQVQRGKIALARKHVSETKRVIKSLSKAVNPKDVLYILEREILRAEVHRIQGDFEEALTLLKQLKIIAKTNRLLVLLVKIRILEAQALEGLGRTKEAMVVLSIALKESAPQGLIKGFYESGSSIKRLLQEMQRIQSVDKAHRVYVQKILKSFDVVDSVREQVQNNLSFDQESASLALLTKREKEVLNLLSYGMSKKEIADSLFISINTIKTHVSSIYAKLGVHTSDELFRYINCEQEN